MQCSITLPFIVLCSNNTSIVEARVCKWRALWREPILRMGSGGFSHNGVMGVGQSPWSRGLGPLKLTLFEKIYLLFYASDSRH